MNEMYALDQGMSDMAFNSGGRHAGDEMLAVRFYRAPKQNALKSQEEGRPVFEDTDYVEIIQPGNKESIVRRPATQRDKQRFAKHWQMYEARVTQDVVEGTPLEEWPQITRSQCEELKFLNVRTVEQLAGLSDANAQNIMGVQVLKAKAKTFLETAKESAIAEKFAALEAKYEALLAEKEEAPAPKRKRRTKAEMAADAAEEADEG